MMESAEYVFDVPNSAWITSNHRFNRWEKQRRVRHLKNLAYLRGIAWPRKNFTQRVFVEVFVHPRTNTNFDPLNVEPTVKALLDGLVKAGVLIDDNWRYVEGPDIRRGQPVRTLSHGVHRIVMKLRVIGEVIEK